MTRSLAALAVAAGSLTLAASAFAAGLPGDRLISRDRAASDLSGYADVLVWSHRAGKRRFQLRLYRGGQTQRVRTRSSREQMDADVGPGPDGQPVVVYRSCRPKCRIFSYTVGTKRERRLRIPQPRRCYIEFPAIHGGTVVYVVGGDRCSPERQGVWMYSGGRSRRVLASDAAQTDVNGSHVVWTHFGDVVNRVRMAPLQPNAPAVSLFADGQRCCGFDVIISNPTFDGDTVYWGDWNNSSKPTDFHRLYRAKATSGAACEASDVTFPGGIRSLNGGFPWIDFTVSGGRVFYITPTGIFERPVTSFASRFSKYQAGSPTAPHCGP